MEMQCSDWKREVCDREGEVSAKFVELGVMGQWRHRLEDRRRACLSMRRRTWWRGIGGRMERAKDR